MSRMVEQAVAEPLQDAWSIGFTGADENITRTRIDRFRSEDAMIRRRTDETIP